jgi:ribosomal protein S18 acetylase RimI-like enzyme
MDQHPDIRIDRASSAPPEELVTYLNELQNNPFAGDPLGSAASFAPLTPATAGLSQGWSPMPGAGAHSLVMGNDLPLNQPGWRRVWLARSSTNQILGHVDLRSHPVRFDVHRCLLGMAVRDGQRRRGIGKLLLAHAERWAAATNLLRRIDLQIRPNNVVALSFYRRSGYANSGEFTDLRFDGRGSARYVRMEKKLHALPSLVTG